MISGRRKRESVSKELIQMGRHFVFSEDTKTREHYIREIKKRISNKYHVGINDVEIIEPDPKKSYNTIGLVERAIKIVSDRVKSGDVTDHVWIFFDKDDFPWDDYKKAIEKTLSLNTIKNGAKNNTYHPCDKKGIAWHACFSNRNFELWYLLHFNCFESKISKRDDYIKRLNEKLQTTGSNYKKGDSTTLERIWKAGGSTEKAIKYAKKLYKANDKQEPSTKVYEFAEFFYPYLDLHGLSKLDKP